MKKRHIQLKKTITRVLTGRAKYITIGFVTVLLLGSSAYAYRATQVQSHQVQQEQTTDTGGIPVSTASPNNLMLVDPSSEEEGTGNLSGQSSSQSSQSSSSASISKQNSTQSSASKASCNYYSDVAYDTVNKPDSSLNVGKTKTVGGVNGSRKVCTDTQGNVSSNEVTYPAVDKTVYYGTYTSDAAMNDAQYACRAIYYDSSNHGTCVSNEMNKRGWYYVGGQWVAS